MGEETFIVKPIGVIRSPFTQAEGTPIQPSLAEGATGIVEVFPEYAEGLQDLKGFERIWLIYWFDRSCELKLKVIPFRDTKERGVFATRAPCRPNKIGLSSVRLLDIKGSILKVADIDILDGTPLLDIKPYVPRFDIYQGARSGWLERDGNDLTRADRRFTSDNDTDL
ncbi:MAG: tRNA (N6-threonylcarbamoyladenosine(37)-N6)-methyltransferase TrmO [candidate division Zixibacteria bacterium]|nr:tRNA (N6-threonylcarbamoyladenosine(37)-N6)-methyltransferase TrmO [candidate division Zixibacteria bacterium]